MKNLPPSWTEREVRAFFETYAEVGGIRMLPPMPGKNGLAAYITVPNLEEALIAAFGLK